MAVEYRRCPTCGNQLGIAGQKFCAICGTTVPQGDAPAPVPAVGSAPPPVPPAAPAGPVPDGITAPYAPPAAPPSWPPPAPPVQAATTPWVPPPAPPAGTAPSWPAPAPPAWPPTAAPPYGAAPQSPYGGAPGQPYGAGPVPPATGSKLEGLAANLPVPPQVAIGIAVAAVVVIVAFFLLSGGGNKPGIAYNPSTLRCTGESFTVTTRLPASVGNNDVLGMVVDGQLSSALSGWTPPGAGFSRQSDNTWLFSESRQTPSATECTLYPGVHSLQIIDMSGAVVAQGSVTRQ